jgi:outer membrane protein
MIAIARTLATLALLVLPATAFGQESSAASDRWSLGVGAAVIDSPYAGEGTRVRPFPLVSYEGDRVFLSGISGGVHLYESDRLTFDAILAARLYGFDISDLGRTELLANGVNPDLLSDRDDGIDAGVRATYRTPLGAIVLEGLRDVSDASDGYEISLDYRHTWQFDQTAVIANAGASWMSSRLSNYYFGVLDEEVARGVAAFSPGSVVVPRIGMSLVRQLGSKWQLLGSIEYEFLPSDLEDSPLLEPDSEGTGRLVLGLNRRF